ncbi:hypothetical protein K438DRAFT_1974726 [Mycena galopus ATCC 62051]|nr:hypothetical protein K438DRAFT_1974726 [Mycena galopus ATCC 62051]
MPSKVLLGSAWVWVWAGVDVECGVWRRGLPQVVCRESLLTTVLVYCPTSDFENPVCALGFGFSQEGLHPVLGNTFDLLTMRAASRGAGMQGVASGGVRGGEVCVVAPGVDLLRPDFVIFLLFLFVFAAARLADDARCAVVRFMTLSQVCCSSRSILSWADTAASTIGRAYGPYTSPLPSSVSLAWLPSWVWVPAFLLAAPPAPANGSANGHANGANGHANGHIKENPKGLKTVRRLKTPFAPRKSSAGFAAACVTGSLVALAFWLGLAGLKGVAEMRAVAEGVPGLGVDSGYHSQYSIAGQYLRSEGGDWARRWVPEGLIGGVAPFPKLVNAQVQHATTPARFGVDGVVGLVALVLCAGVVSGVAEALDLGGLDDNLTLPIISGAALMLFFRVWGWAQLAYSRAMTHSLTLHPSTPPPIFHAPTILRFYAPTPLP